MGIRGCIYEFAAYRILYYLLVLGKKKFDAATSGIKPHLIQTFNNAFLFVYARLDDSRWGLV
jgi:hypothetical protein